MMERKKENELEIISQMVCRSLLGRLYKLIKTFEQTVWVCMPKKIINGFSQINTKNMRNFEELRKIENKVYEEIKKDIFSKLENNIKEEEKKNDI